MATQTSESSENSYLAPAEYVVRATIGDEPTENDTLGFEPYVNAVRDFLLAPATKPPLTLSIEGAWGTGKSSFMRQLKNGLHDMGNSLTVEFNPWRHEREDALWAAFAVHFIQGISKQLSFGKRWAGHIRLLFTRFDWQSSRLDVVKAVLLLILFFCGAVAVLALLVLEGQSWLDSLDGWFPTAGNKEWLKVLIGLGGAATAISAVLTLFGKVKVLISNPLGRDLKRHLKSPDYVARISFVENFHKDFRKIVDAYVRDKQVFIFIDDLDRCAAPKAADLMQAISLMIADDPRLFFIVGIDREKVAAGLAVKFERAIRYLDESSTTSEARRGLEFGYNFVEKFIQVPFLIPQPKVEKLTNLLETPVQTSKRAPARNWMTKVKDWWMRLQQSRQIQPPDDEPEIDDANAPDDRLRQIRQRYRLMVGQTDSETVGEIVGWATPFLDYNPRRIKQFVNLFRLRVLIANETGLFDESEDQPLALEQIAKFVIITLKWPLFLRDLQTDPGLPEALHTRLGETLPQADRQLVERWGNQNSLIELLSFAPAQEEDDPDYILSRGPVEKLLRAWPFARSTEERIYDSQAESTDDEKESNEARKPPGYISEELHLDEQTTGESLPSVSDDSPYSVDATQRSQSAPHWEPLRSYLRGAYPSLDTARNEKQIVDVLDLLRDLNYRTTEQIIEALNTTEDCRKKLGPVVHSPKSGLDHVVRSMVCLRPDLDTVRRAWPGRDDDFYDRVISAIRPEWNRQDV